MVRDPSGFGASPCIPVAAKVTGVEVHLVTHPCFDLHDTGRWHPERPARLAAAVAGVRGSGLDVLEVEAEEVDPAVLERVHSPAYIRSIERFCAQGGGSLDPDTVAVVESWEAALRSAGAGPQAVDLVAATPDSTGFLAIRPPGHHALMARAMGFCLFNNIAVASRRQIDAGQRVAVIDWDVHHGNGTQDSFLEVPDLLYASFHQHPFYPGTGYMTEVGTGAAAGTNVNVPVPAGTAGDVYREGFARLTMPILRQFDPDWIFVSAGYDAHDADPLAELRLLASDYAVMAAALHSLGKPVVYFLEGGYDLDAIEASVAATLQGAAGRAVPEEIERHVSPTAAWRALEDAVGVMQSFWRL
jgi:acetoin utilization deacetylase AcuC-like enzyme